MSTPLSVTAVPDVSRLARGHLSEAMHATLLCVDACIGMLARVHLTDRGRGPLSHDVLNDALVALVEPNFQPFPGVRIVDLVILALVLHIKELHAAAPNSKQAVLRRMLWTIIRSEKWNPHVLVPPGTRFYGIDRKEIPLWGATAPLTYLTSELLKLDWWPPELVLSEWLPHFRSGWLDPSSTVGLGILSHLWFDTSSVVELLSCGFDAYEWLLRRDMYPRYATCLLLNRPDFVRDAVWAFLGTLQEVCPRMPAEIVPLVSDYVWVEAGCCRRGEVPGGVWDAVLKWNPSFASMRTPSTAIAAITTFRN